MANHKDAVKRARQAIGRRARNRHNKSTMRTHIKSLLDAVATGDKAVAKAELEKAASAIDKLSQKGIIHKKQAARRVSRLATRVNALGK